jgi:hypothetical protein
MVFKEFLKASFLADNSSIQFHVLVANKLFKTSNSFFYSFSVIIKFVSVFLGPICEILSSMFHNAIYVRCMTT